MDDGKLISLVQAYPHLYDKKRADFKDARKKLNSWQEIAQLMEYSVEDVQNRWKYLREKYNRERNFDKNLPSGSGTPDRVEWEWFQSLKWLEMHMIKRRTKSNLGKMELVRDESPNVEEIEVLVEVNESEPGAESRAESRAESSNSERSTNTPRGVKRKFMEPGVASALTDMGKCFNSVATSLIERHYPKHESEDELFGKQVSAFLNKLTNKKKKREFKQKVFSYMMEVEAEEEMNE